MENTDVCIFHKRDEQVIYKQILSNYTLNEIISFFEKSEFVDNSTNTANREILVDTFPDGLFDDIKSEIKVALSDYFLFDIYGIRGYKQNYGEIKIHTDKSYDGLSNHTLLIYINDTFEGSDLHIKTKMTSTEKGDKKENYFVFKIKPLAGYGIIFNKNMLHWSPEIYGVKYTILIDLHVKV